MNISITEFLEKTGKLKEHINGLQTIKKYFDSKLESEEEVVKQTLRIIQRDKVFNYRANVISLYGNFEQFVESVIGEYIANLSVLLPNYRDLNKSLQENYPNLMFSLYGKLHYPKFSAIKETDITQSLYDTINQNLSKVKAEAFIQNGGNYRQDEISNALNRFGVSELSAKLKFYRHLYNRLISDYPEAAIGSLKSDEAYARLNEFVDRRNDIAHGVNQMPIVGDEAFTPLFIEYMEDYAKSLNSFLEDHLYALKYQAAQTHTPLRVFSLREKDKPKTIMGIELENMEIHVGQKLMCLHPSYPIYEEMNIVGICDDRTPVDTFTFTSKRPIGIKVSAPITEGCRFIFL